MANGKPTLIYDKLPLIVQDKIDLIISEGKKGQPVDTMPKDEVQSLREKIAELPERARTRLEKKAQESWYSRYLDGDKSKISGQSR